MSEETASEAPNPILDAIEAAEAIADPLDGLVERTHEDVGAPFEAEVLEALARLKADDLPAFQRLRNRLKSTGCLMGELDRALRTLAGSPDEAPGQADVLAGFANEARLFHTRDCEAFAEIEKGGHCETWAVMSEGFARWLRARYFEETGGAPNSEALRAAVNLIEARAIHEGEEEATYLRCAVHEGRLYVDLCNDAWEAAEVDAWGWRVVARSPVRFRRASGMLALPRPEPGGSLAMLKSHLNIADEAGFILLCAWMLAALTGTGPYPVLVVHGGQGSAKSSFCRLVRSLIDPNRSMLRPLPREEGDLYVSAANGWLLSFDNVSTLPNWLSDSLCRVSTGGGHAKRKLYTDKDETVIEAMRPVILNGIETMVTRADLADRSLFLRLETIPDERRRTEAELSAAFEADRPALFGALLDGLVLGLKQAGEVQIDRLPRMADFALASLAREATFAEAGRFLAAYEANRHEASEDMVEADGLGSAIAELMADLEAWQGTAKDLLRILRDRAAGRLSGEERLPASPRALSQRLARIEPALAAIGIPVARFKEGRKRRRVISIARGAGFHHGAEDGDFASAASASSARGNAAGPSGTPDADAADDADANFPHAEGHGNMNGAWQDGPGAH